VCPSILAVEMLALAMEFSRIAGHDRRLGLPTSDAGGSGRFDRATEEATAPSELHKVPIRRGAVPQPGHFPRFRHCPRDDARETVTGRTPQAGVRRPTWWIASGSRKLVRPSHADGVSGRR